MEEQPNLNYIKEISGGDHDFEKKLIDVVKSEIFHEIEEYEENLNELRLTKAAENVHKLKHKISILGLEKGYQTAIEFENELKEGKISLRQQFNEILNCMVTYIRES
jgi:HPt (histidine-containing phosphotransfer) domain-containing protein